MQIPGRKQSESWQVMLPALMPLENAAERHEKLCRNQLVLPSTSTAFAYATWYNVCNRAGCNYRCVVCHKQFVQQVTVCMYVFKCVHKIAFERENLRKAPRRMSFLSLLRWRVVVVCSSIMRFTCNNRILHFPQLGHKFLYFMRTACKVCMSLAHCLRQ